MYFGVSEWLHLLSQKQVWSGPSGASSLKANVSLTCGAQFPSGRPGPWGPEEQAKAFWEVTENGKVPQCTERFEYLEVGERERRSEDKKI